MNVPIYGDGIHDDFPGIQERIDSGVCELILPPPKKYYLISRTLVLPSGFRLVLPRFAEIRLADGADCPMLRNRWKELPESGKRSKFQGNSRPWDFIWRYTETASRAPEDACRNIEVCGGVWNFNNKRQTPNPIATKTNNGRNYNGFGMQFFNVRNFKLSSLTLKDPVTFAVTMDLTSFFTVEDITFDFNYGNPAARNMDGIHINGNCSHGVLRNLKGACYDDLIALNAHEGCAGPITDIEIDGVFAEDCHSAVRLLAVDEKVENVHISNIYGTFYQYCVGITAYYGIGVEGFDAISIDHVCASKAIRYPDRYPQKETDPVLPLIWIQDGVILKNLTVRSLYRRERNVPVETLFIGNTARPVERIIMDDVSVTDETGTPAPVVVNRAEIGVLSLSEVRANGEILKNEGTIGMLNLRNMPPLSE